MKSNFLVVGILALLSSVAHAAPATAPLLELKAKSISYGLVQPIPPIANLVVASLGPSQKPALDECLAKQHIQPRNYRGLMLWGVFPSSPAHRLHVVRASTRYCGVFYGPRDFSYFLIDEGRGGTSSMKLIFKNRGDRLLILPTVTNGLNEIEATGCDDRGCRIARMAFNGQTYRSVQCEESVIRGKTETRKPRTCGSDGFADDQAPPPTAKPKR